MRKEFVLALDKNYDRPIVSLKNGISVLMDTGARFPVWCASGELLKEQYDCTLVKENVSFSGFGGMARGNLYKIHSFEFGKLMFPYLPVIVCEDDEFDCAMLVSAPMFDKLVLNFDFANHRVIVQIPDKESTIRNIVITKDGKRIVLANQ